MTRNASFYLLATLVVLLCLFLAYPLFCLFSKSFYADDTFSGLRSFSLFFSTPGLINALSHTLTMGVAVTTVTLILAFILAYAITHTRMAGLALCNGLALLPLFVPSLFPALGLLYLFGRQGLVTIFLGDITLYGPVGIFLGSLLYTLPHALLPLISSLRDMDPHLYLAGKTLGAGPWRRFFTITLPGARYGIVNAATIIFILTVTDFGVPKILGGDYSMLATEIFRQIVGMQDFSMGATAGLILLVPCLPVFFIDRWVRNKQRLQRKGEPLSPIRHLQRDAAFSLLAWGVLILPLASVGMVVWGSFISFWPYELGMTLENYSFNSSVYGILPFANSLSLAFTTALVGTLCIFGGAYITTRVYVPAIFAGVYRLLAIIPLAIPGIVLGVAYILAFSIPGTFLSYIYGSIPFLAINCIIHFYTVCHVTATGSLSSLDPNYETVGATLGASRLRTFFKIIIPMQKNTIADIAFYLFVNALTTISAVIFLYTPETLPASVAILQMLDSGAIAEASAMGTLLLAAALGARILRALSVTRKKLL